MGAGKRTARAVVIAAGIFLLGSKTITYASDTDNMISNGAFSSGLEPWTTYQEGGKADQYVEEEAMVVSITDIGKVDYAVQAYIDGFSLQEGCVYNFSFDAQSTIARTIEWRVQLNGGDYHAYASEIVEIGTEPTHIETQFTMEEPTDPAPRLCFNLGTQPGCPEGLNEHTICFDNISLSLADASGAVAEEAEEEVMAVLVNQVGYLNGAVKKAVVRGAQGGSFELIDEDGVSVYSGTLETAVHNAASDEEVCTADFSDYTETGTYLLRTESGEESAPFYIGEDVYDTLSADVLRMFYLQRCGVVEDEVFGHEACHTQSAEIYGTDQILESHGGWHDAGDYGRYIVAGAKAAADLLLAYENYGAQFEGETAGGSGMPAILVEVKYELDWMLTMQESQSGGVYHKITGEVFPGVVWPQEETAKMVVSPISTTATGDFAAVMAMAARLIPDEAYQKTCLEAARRAWAYLEETPSDSVGFKNPEGIVTGEYDDANDTDERFWAAAELYRTTGEEAFAQAAQKMDLSSIQADLGWQDVGVYGMYAYAQTAGEDDTFAAAVRERFTELADVLLQKSEADVYGASLGTDEYVWGSNMLIADNGMLLLMADQLSPDNTYVKAAQRQLHYLLGTNTTGYSYVTGYGTKSAEHPHHRPSQAAGTAMKGMLVGGPDSGLQDPYAAQVLQNLPPAACYTDNDQSYSTNEVTIYWNSPLVYLLAGLRA